MTLAAAKIDAQRVLMRTRSRAVAVSLLTLLLKGIFIVAFGICVYSLTVLLDDRQVAGNIYLYILYIVLFSLGAVFSVLFYAWAGASLRRWFYKNAVSPQTVGAYFAKYTFRSFFKTVYLFWLRKLLVFGSLLGYLAPFLLGSAGLFYLLRVSEISVPLLILSLSFLGVLFALGVFFGFAAIQKYTFVDGLLADTPACGVIEALATSRRIARPISFALARTKLRFSLWMLLSALIVPLLYVMPYYCQSVGCIVKKALDKNHLTPDTQMPIVFLRLAKSPA